MIKTFVKCIREYKTPTLLTLFFIILEVFLEVQIISLTADLVNAVNAGHPMDVVLHMGLSFSLKMAPSTLVPPTSRQML